MALLEVGRIGGAHGLRGEVAVVLVSNRLERLAPGSRLHTDAGPLRVEAARPHGNRHLVRFEGVGDRNRAERLRGLILRAEPIADADELWVHDLIGTRVVDQHGEDRGEVAAVVANPAGDLLELADGTLVPLRFAVRCMPGRPIEVDAPEGLFELAGDRSPRETR